MTENNNGRVTYRTAGIVLTACIVAVSVTLWLSAEMSKLDMTKADKTEVSALRQDIKQVELAVRELTTEIKYLRGK